MKDGAAARVLPSSAENIGLRKKADVSGNEVPIDVSVTISRITGELTIQRRRDNNSQHDTRNGSLCTVFKSLF
jgi:hypothetical protein